MKSKIYRCGNSLAIRIPQSAIRRTGLREGDEVEIAINQDAVVIGAARPKYTLESLLDRITPDSLHSQTDWGLPQGREDW